MIRLSEHLSELLDNGEPVILVNVEDAKGSTPRSTDARMLVTAGKSFGTIGGGELEWRGLASARRMLETGEGKSRIIMALGPETGQCCGGRVVLNFQHANRLTLEKLTQLEDDAHSSDPQVLIFGAGHVGRALAVALSPLPLRVNVFDTRPEAMVDWPEGIDLEICAVPETAIEAAPESAAFIILTHDHGLDFLLTEAALKRQDAAYVGMIGSKTKRRRFERYVSNHGVSGGMLAGLTSPIGTQKVTDKRPAVIAALVAAELLTVFDQHIAPDKRVVGVRNAVAQGLRSKDRSHDV